MDENQAFEVDLEDEQTAIEPDLTDMQVEDADVEDTQANEDVDEAVESESQADETDAQEDEAKKKAKPTLRRTPTKVKQKKTAEEIAEEKRNPKLFSGTLQNMHRTVTFLVERYRQIRIFSHGYARVHGFLYSYEAETTWSKKEVVSNKL